MNMKNICVFCGSGTGVNPVYAEGARRLGETMAERGLDLVYGGSNIGLMGLVSAAVRDAGGLVKGIIPRRIADHVEGQHGIDVEVVSDMHTRKARMYELSDAVIALPGGIGTMDELFEAWVWNQLGYHTLPLALLNINGYYEDLLTYLDSMTSEGFLRKEQRESLIVSEAPGILLDALSEWSPPGGPKWNRIG